MPPREMLQNHAFHSHHDLENRAHWRRTVLVEQGGEEVATGSMPAACDLSVEAEQGSE